MQSKKILAESGGTKTDWCFFDGENGLYRFQTASFHPELLTAETLNDFTQQVASFSLSEFDLYLYSAGCFKQAGKDKLSYLLKELPFKSIQIDSDLKAAILCTGTTAGNVAILGTGSALLTFDQENMNLFGGKGWETGDEGSGFYFGKLIVEEMLKGNPFPELSFDRQKELCKAYGHPSSKQLFSQLSVQLPPEMYASFHQKNIQLFFELYVMPMQMKEITFVGGYAFAQQKVVCEIAQAYHVHVLNVVKQPIDLLIKQQIEG